MLARGQKFTNNLQIIYKFTNKTEIVTAGADTTVQYMPGCCLFTYCSVQCTLYTVYLTQKPVIYRDRLGSLCRDSDYFWHSVEAVSSYNKVHYCRHKICFTKLQALRLILNLWAILDPASNYYSSEICYRGKSCRSCRSCFD